MDIRQCRECGALFQSIGNPICPDCVRLIDDYFLKVRDYIYRNPEATILEVSEKTEVSERHILNFLKEERLTLENATGFLLCEMCKRPITKGRYCESCTQELRQALPVIQQPSAPIAREKDSRYSALFEERAQTYISKNPRKK